jgi:hypothetical protein
MAGGDSDGLAVKGINYDVGTEYEPGVPTRMVWRPDLVRAELRSIAEDLHCNAVTLYGTDPERLREAAETALDLGLAAWIQPRLIDATPRRYLDHLDRVARVAEDLRAAGGRVVLNVGCEMSLLIRGMLPGRTFTVRSELLGWGIGRLLLPRSNRRLSALLATAAERARRHFGGDLTYGAGLWEWIDWAPFDLVGLNQYRIAENQDVYVSVLRNHVRHDKPVVITEFGCGSYAGASRVGPNGHEVIDWRSSRPRLAKELRRDEDEQAAYITELLEIYAEEGVHGAFVFQYIEPVHAYDDDSRYDLDRAGYGIVRVRGEDAERPYSAGFREPKKSFHAISRMYARM